MSYLVSICIPSYNCEKYISATIESILAQNYSNFEIIISDDCSTDNTVQIIKKYSDPRIKFHSNEKNLGIEGNWNKLLLLAKGKYIKLVCCDDILYPGCIQEQVKVLSLPVNSNIILVSSHRNIINSKNEAILWPKSLLKVGRNNSRKVKRLCIRIGTNLIGEPAVGMFKKETIEKFDIRYSGTNPYMIDLDFWFQLLDFGDLYVLDKILAGFRISDNSLSHNFGLKQAKLFQQFIMKEYHKKEGMNLLDVILGYCSSFFLGILRNLVFLIKK